MVNKITDDVASPVIDQLVLTFEKAGFKTYVVNLDTGDKVHEMLVEIFNDLAIAERDYLE